MDCKCTGCDCSTINDCGDDCKSKCCQHGLDKDPIDATEGKD